MMTLIVPLWLCPAPCVLPLPGGRPKEMASRRAPQHAGRHILQAAPHGPPLWRLSCTPRALARRAADACGNGGPAQRGVDGGWVCGEPLVPSRLHHLCRHLTPQRARGLVQDVRRTQG